MATNDHFYRAFISYSHADKASALWLHRALETYRIPRKLVGSVTAAGVVPARLHPIFRDREELPASGDLSAELQAALRSSLFLIVIVSPKAAASRWVNEEIRRFKMIHGEGNVLALIAGSVAPGTAGADCFPPALRYRVSSDGTITDVIAEPIAADLRPGTDGKRLAKLKLAAGLTGLRLDALVQRENARRQQRLALVAAVAGVIALAMTVLAVVAVRARAAAERQRAQSDGLVEYMLTDLRKKLEPVGRLEVLDSVGQKAMAYYGAQKLADLDADALGRRARALHLVGEVRDLRGDSAGALEAFTEAATSTAELLARHPSDPQQIFDHAQSVYWVGYIAWQRKDAAIAEARFRDYDRLAAQLVASDSANAKWQQEQAYAHNNLGTLYLERGRYAEAADRFRRGQAIEEKLAAAAPGDSQHQWLLAQGHAWIADALSNDAQLAAATFERRQELAIYDAVLVRDPRDAKARESRAVALNAIARLETFQGKAAAAVVDSTAALETITALAASDPSNRSWQETALFVTNVRTEALMMNRDWEAAARSNVAALVMAKELVVLDPTVVSWRHRGLMEARWMEIAIAYRRGERALAHALTERFFAEFALDKADVPTGSEPWLMVETMAGIDARARGDSDAAARHFAAARALVPAQPTGRSVAIAALFDTLSETARTDAVTASEYSYNPRVIFESNRGK